MRIEATVANAGAAICQSWGCKIRPKELIPQFTRPVVNNKLGIEVFSAWVDAHNKKFER